MKQFLLCIFSIGSLALYSQDISSINSGANSNNDLIYSVGEIFVLPETNSDEVNSGIIGVISRIEFFVTGVDNLLVSENIHVYPNPTSQSLFFSTDQLDIKQISIYSNNGQLIATKTLTNNQVDLTDLPDGIYFIRPNNLKVKAFKIIKK